MLIVSKTFVEAVARNEASLGLIGTEPVESS